jgi:type VI protein secretion system component Hcp
VSEQGDLGERRFVTPDLITYGYAPSRRSQRPRASRELGATPALNRFHARLVPGRISPIRADRKVHGHMSHLRLALAIVTVLLFAFATRSAEAATRIYVQFETSSGLVGASTDKAHPKWIEVESYSLESRPVTAGAAADRDNPERKYGSLSLVVAEGVSLPAIARASAQGKVIKSAVIEVNRQVAGVQVEVLRITVTDVLIKGYALTQGADRPRATVKLAFEKIMFQYMKGDASGNLGPAQAPPPSWDVTSGTKI